MVPGGGGGGAPEPAGGGGGGVPVIIGGGGTAELEVEELEALLDVVWHAVHGMMDVEVERIVESV